MPDFESQRKQLIEQIKAKGINDSNVLNAVKNVPRHEFMLQDYMHVSYNDNAFPISDNQTISQPYTVAMQTVLLEIIEGEKILEIGTGSGYQSAILAEMGAEVYSIERIENLYNKAKKLLNRLNYNVNLFHKDGHKGLKKHKPFDKIIITAAVDNIPYKLLEQLKIGGILVAPIGGSMGQTMTKIIKEENKIIKKEYGAYRFVPMLKNTK